MNADRDVGVEKEKGRQGRRQSRSTEAGGKWRERR